MRVLGVVVAEDAAADRPLQHERVAAVLGDVVFDQVVGVGPEQVVAVAAAAVGVVGIGDVAAADLAVEAQGDPDEALGRAQHLDVLDPAVHCPVHLDAIVNIVDALTGEVVQGFDCQVFDPGIFNDAIVEADLRPQFGLQGPVERPVKLERPVAVVALDPHHLHLPNSLTPGVLQPAPGGSVCVQERGIVVLVNRGSVRRCGSRRRPRERRRSEWLIPYKSRLRWALRPRAAPSGRRY